MQVRLVTDLATETSCDKPYAYLSANFCIILISLLVSSDEAEIIQKVLSIQATYNFNDELPTHCLFLQIKALHDDTTGAFIVYHGSYVIPLLNYGGEHVLFAFKFQFNEILEFCLRKLLIQHELLIIKVESKQAKARIMTQKINIQVARLAPNNLMLCLRRDAFT